MPRFLLHIALVFSMAISFVACKDSTIEIPPHIIPQDSAVILFTELQILEALVIQGSLHQKDTLLSIEAYKQGVLQKLNMSQARVEESFNFYLSHPSLLDQIYTEVLINLSKLQAEVEANPMPPERHN
jgi:hypothetical protein